MSLAGAFRLPPMADAQYSAPQSQMTGKFLATMDFGTSGLRD